MIAKVGIVINFRGGKFVVIKIQRHSETFLADQTQEEFLDERLYDENTLIRHKDIGTFSIGDIVTWEYELLTMRELIEKSGGREFLIVQNYTVKKELPSELSRDETDDWKAFIGKTKVHGKGTKGQGGKPRQSDGPPSAAGDGHGPLGE